MLLPALSKAREKARIASCLSNIKNISLGLMMYSQDNKDTVCYSTETERSTTDYWGKNTTWRSLTMSYLGSNTLEQINKIYGCPSCSSRTAELSHHVTDYCMAYFACGIAQGTIKNPTQSELLMDSGRLAATSTYMHHIGHSSYISVAQFTQDAYRHGSVINASFQDGHATSLATKLIDMTKSDKWNTGQYLFWDPQGRFGTKNLGE